MFVTPDLVLFRLHFHFLRSDIPKTAIGTYLLLLLLLLLLLTLLFCSSLLLPLRCYDSTLMDEN